MKHKIQKILAAVAVLLGCFTMIALGQVLRPLPLPATWAAANGNYFRLTSSAVPELRVGTNTYTGATTNLAFSNGAETNTIRIVNGVITGILD